MSLAPALILRGLAAEAGITSHPSHHTCGHRSGKCSDRRFQSAARAGSRGAGLLWGLRNEGRARS